MRSARRVPAFNFLDLSRIKLPGWDVLPYEGSPCLKLLAFRSSTPSRPSESGEHAVGRLLLENLDSLYSTAHRLTGRADLAGDLVQETAGKALRAAGALTSQRNLRAWLFTILVNAVRDHLRRQERWTEHSLEDEVGVASLEVEILSSVPVQDVRRAVSRLPLEQRAVVILVDLEGFTISEAAQMLRLPPGTVASRLGRAHQALRDCLRDYASPSEEIGGQP
ncbi:MAG: RNA polymerase sigma factor [Bryobacteraceae bacterium]